MTVLDGGTHVAPFEASVDAVVVGSGAGGAVAARELARAGLSVLVLEEGGHHPPEAYARMSPSQALRNLAREAGLGIAMGLGDTPLISVMAGRCVGGSSVLTGGVCFRVPDEVLHDWSTRLGLAGMTPERLDPFFTELERDLEIETVPEHMRSRSTELFVEGADKLGVEMKPLRRNAPRCKGASRCNFGCPHGAKMSVDVSVLPEARARGVTIVAGAFVSRVTITRGVAHGVTGRLASGARLRVQARVVVLACGAQHTPLLLERSGRFGRHVGVGLTLHPAFRVGALFDERVEGWDGAMQSVYSDHFAREGLTLVSAYSAPSVLAAAFPGVGRAHRDLVRSMPHLAFFGAMLHDEPGGRVRRWLSREPLLTYRMSARDRKRLVRGIEVLGQLAFAAGARAVVLPVFGAEPIRSVAELRALVERPPPMRRIECMSFHPLGSARMSRDPDEGVVDPDGRTWAAENLYVADGSVLPTSIGVNSQLPVMAVAMRIARHVAARFSETTKRAA